METRTSKLNPQILEEATAWFVDFNEEEVGPAGREEFNAWLRRSPEHVRAFLQVSAFWEDARTLSKRPGLDIEDLIARAKTEHNVHPLELSARERVSNPPQRVTAESIRRPAENYVATSQNRESSRSRRGRFWLATAASIVVSLSIGGIGWQAFFSAPAYATQIGEQRSITLEDGSSVELNSRSRIRVRFTDAERSVDLLEGQALFTVAKNPARPFIVATGDTRVRAVGTQFDVYRKSAGTVVTVIEGRVAVSPARATTHPSEGASGASQRVNPDSIRGSGDSQGPGEDSEARHTVDGAKPEASSRSEKQSGPIVWSGEVLLAAGEQLTITPTEIELPKPTNIAVATAWTDKRLVFESTPLREVVEEFNRYNRQQLVIRDPDLYDVQISGIFPSADPNRIVEFLRQRFGVTMNRSRNEIEISHPKPPDVDSSQRQTG